MKERNKTFYINKIQNSPYLISELIKYISLANSITEESIKEANERNRILKEYAQEFEPQYLHLFN